MDSDESSGSVGPVLIANAAGRAVVEAIQRRNTAVRVVDRGAYLRVLVPQRCVFVADDVRQPGGEPFELPIDLEAVMPAYQGTLRVDGRTVEWI
jgi:hypothetical protein